MKRTTLTLAAIAVLSFALVACDELTGSDPSGPDLRLSVDFECENETDPTVLECSAIVTGGAPPIEFEWQATNQRPQISLGVSAARFDYTDQCSISGVGVVGLDVEVVLTVKDDDRTTVGPVRRNYTVC